MKTKFFTIVLIIAFFTSNAQHFGVKGYKQFADTVAFPLFPVMLGLCPTQDNGFAATINNIFDHQTYFSLKSNVTKFDSTGAVVFSKTIVGNYDSLEDGNLFIMEDLNKNILAAGGTGDYGVNSVLDISLSSFDSVGNFNFYKTYGSSGLEWGESVTQTFDNGYAIGGSTNKYHSNGNIYEYNFCLIKTDPEGNMLWNRAYGTTADDFLWAMTQLPDSGFLLGGYTRINSVTHTDVLLIKTNKSGHVIWSKVYHNPNTLGRVQATGFGVVNDSTFFMFGFEDDTTGFPGQFISLLDTVGNVKYTLKYPCITGVQFMPPFYDKTNNCVYLGGINVCDSIVGTCALYKLDLNGNILNAVNYTRNNYGTLNYVTVTPQNEIIFADLSSFLDSTFYFVRLDSTMLGSCQAPLIAPVIDTISFTVTNINVLDTEAYFIENTYTPAYYDPNVIETTYCTPLATEKEKAESGGIELFPNPAHDAITVQSTNPDSYRDNVQSIEIENVVGEKVYQSSLSFKFGNSVKIPVGDLGAGIYFVKVTTDKGSVVRKFIKQ